MSYEFRLLHLGQGECLAALREHDGLLLLLGLADSGLRCRNAQPLALFLVELCLHDGVLLVAEAGIGIRLYISEPLLVEEVNQGLQPYAELFGDFIDSYGHKLCLNEK